MKNCETFCLLARRDEGVGWIPRLKSNKANWQKGRSPQGQHPVPSGAAALDRQIQSSAFSFQGISTGS